MFEGLNRLYTDSSLIGHGLTRLALHFHTEAVKAFNAIPLGGRYRLVRVITEVASRIFNVGMAFTIANPFAALGFTAKVIHNGCKDISNMVMNLFQGSKNAWETSTTTRLPLQESRQYLQNPPSSSSAIPKKVRNGAHALVTLASKSLRTTHRTLRHPITAFCNSPKDLVTTAATTAVVAESAYATISVGALLCGGGLQTILNVSNLIGRINPIPSPSTCVAFGKGISNWVFLIPNMAINLVAGSRDMVSDHPWIATAVVVAGVTVVCFQYKNVVKRRWEGICDRTVTKLENWSLIEQERDDRVLPLVLHSKSKEDVDRKIRKEELDCKEVIAIVPSRKLQSLVPPQAKQKSSWVKTARRCSLWDWHLGFLWKHTVGHCRAQRQRLRARRYQRFPVETPSLKARVNIMS